MNESYISVESYAGGHNVCAVEGNNAALHFAAVRVRSNLA